MEKKEKIKNIIFDLGGIIADLDGNRCIKAFKMIGCGKVAEYVEEHRTEDLFLDFELGRISSHKFCEAVRSVSHVQVGDEDITWAWNELITGIPHEKLDKIIALRGRYNLLLLSNTNEMHWNRVAEEFFPYRQMVAEDYFRGGIYLSNVMGMAKPSAEIFKAVAADAGIEPEETLFIDDIKENTDAAQALGFNVLNDTGGGEWMKLL